MNTLSYLKAATVFAIASSLALQAQAPQSSKATSGSTPTASQPSAYAMPIGGGGGGDPTPPAQANCSLVTPAVGHIDWTGVGITFLASSTTPGATFSWAFGDGGTGTGASTSHSYSAEGPYSISVTVTASGYTATTVSQTITITSPAVISTFEATPNPVLQGQAVTLKWNVSGATSVTLSPSIGDVTNLASRLVTPSATTTYTLSATNTGGTATTSVTVTTLSIGVNINPPSASLKVGGIQSFTATIIPISASQGVSWSVVSGSGGINPTSGLFTAPSVAGTTVIKATSQADTTKSATCTVTITSVAQLTWRRDILYMGGKEIAEVDGAGMHVTQVDHLGSPRFVSGPTGNLEDIQKFLPYGESLDGLGRSSKGFTNHEKTDESGLIYMQARFYSPTYGRFLSPDPALDQHFEETQSWNIFSYIRNQPTMKADPTGEIGVPEMLGLVSDLVTYLAVKQATAPKPTPQQIRATQDQGLANLKEIQRNYIAITGGVFVLQMMGTTPEVEEPESVEIETSVGESASLESKSLTRNWGGDSGPYGKSWTTDPVPSQSRNSLGIETTNTAEFVSHGTLTDTAGVATQRATPWGRFAGGGQETLVPDPVKQIRLDAVTMPDDPIPFELPSDPVPMPSGD